MTARLAASLVAILCWVGLAFNFASTFNAGHDALATLWILLRFFTITTNLLLAIVMTWIAVGGRPSALILGGVTIAILLVGIVYLVLLKGMHELSGHAAIADVLLHDATPVLGTLWWVLFAPRAKLKWNAPLWWSLYPVAYLVYALVRGHADGKYPYPFLDVGRLGWMQAALNIGGIALGFILAGFLLVWVDRWRPLGSRRNSR